MVITAQIMWEQIMFDVFGPKNPNNEEIRKIQNGQFGCNDMSVTI